MSLSSPGIKEDILIEAIRAVKSQRQRPGADRIFRWLRFHKSIRRVDSGLVSAALEVAVAKGSIRKVVRGARETYAEWKKSRRDQRPASGKITIASAICHCIQQQGALEGLPLERICDHMTKMASFKDMDRLVLKYHVRLHCEKAVKRGKLLKDGRSYRLARSGQVRWNMEGKELDSNISFLADRAVTNKKPATPIEICSFCLGSQQKNRNGDPEEMLYCVECGRGGHPSCLKFSASLTEKAKKMRWQCIECKRCSVCSQSSREHMMLFCDSCDRGYHMDCCQPPIQKRPRGVWICCICAYEVDQKKSFYFADDGFAGIGRKFTNGHSEKRKFSKRRCDALDSSDCETTNCFYRCQPFAVSQADEDWFKTAQRLTREKLLGCQVAAAETTAAPDTSWNTPQLIEIGKYEVATWYSSPFPHIFAKLPKLYVCEFCLRYMESRAILKNHSAKCFLLRPPGDEIYRDGNLSIFEVDGNVAKVYCQDLCLLAKLFLDHKTLFYDVEPFVFYVLTINDELGCHLVGYFSKEKNCVHNYNLSCIMVLPQFQRHGYGRLLIDFSYLLSRRECRAGTPEKPLSELGQLTYESYWKDVIEAYLWEHLGKTLSMKDISTDTGICTQDVLNTLLALKMLHSVGDSYKIVYDRSEALDRSTKKKTALALVPERLCWTPFALRSTAQTDESEAFDEPKDLSANDEASEAKKTAKLINCSTPLVPSRPRRRQSAVGALVELSPIGRKIETESGAGDGSIGGILFNGHADSITRRPCRKKRGWVKGRKRLPLSVDPRPTKESTVVNEECGGEVLGFGQRLVSELSVTDNVLSVPNSSIAQTQSKITAQQELQNSEVNELFKTSADDTRETLSVEGTTEIYDVSHDEVKEAASKTQDTDTAPADPRDSLAPDVYEKTKDDVVCLPMESPSEAGKGRKSENFSTPDSTEKIRGVEADDEYVDLLSTSILAADVRSLDSSGCDESEILSPCDAASSSSSSSSSLSANDSQVVCQLPNVELTRNRDGRRKYVVVKPSDKSVVGNLVEDGLSEAVDCVERNDTDSSIVSEVEKELVDENFGVHVGKNLVRLVIDAKDESFVANTLGESFIAENDAECKQNFISVSADCFARCVTDDVRSINEMNVSRDSSDGADLEKADRETDAETEIISSVGDDVGVEQSAKESMTFEVMSTVGLLASLPADASDTNSFDDSDSDGTISLNLDGVEDGISCDYFSGSLAFAKNKRLSSCTISCLQNVLIPIGSAEDVDSEDGKIARNGVFCLRDYHRLDHRVLRKNGRLNPTLPRNRKGKILIETDGVVGDAFLAKEPIVESVELKMKASDDSLKTNEISDSCKADGVTRAVERSHLQTSEKIKPFQLSSNCCVNSVEDW